MSARRSLWAGLFATVLLLGVFDWHPAEESSYGLAHGGEIYFPSAAHPSQPAHFEAATPAEHPVCPACLHNLRAGGAHLQPAAALVPPASETTAAPDLALPLTHGCRRPSGARGPPSFS
jgi:hypothetical protein